MALSSYMFRVMCFAFVRSAHSLLRNTTHRSIMRGPGEVKAPPGSISVGRVGLTTDELDAPGSALIFDGPFMMYATHHLETDAKLAQASDEPGTMLNLQTGMVVIAAFALMYLYIQWHEAIARHTGLQLAHVCCVIYSSISVTIDISIKNAAEAYGGAFPFNPACGVVVVEYAKLVASLVLLAVNIRALTARGDVVQLPTVRDVGWLAVPAMIYAACNLLCFQAIKSTPLATFGVVRETMLIWNAFFWSVCFGQNISALRWLAIVGIFFGCCVNQIPHMMNDDLTFGVVWTALLAVTNAGGAVINEFAMKKSPHLDINLQNSIMYALCGTFVLIGIAIFNRSSVRSTNAFFNGFVPECWTVLALQAFAGLAVSRILKYVEAVTKTIAAAMRGPGVVFLGAFVFHQHLAASEIVASVCVCISCWFYLRQGPLTTPKVASDARKL